MFLKRDTKRKNHFFLKLQSKNFKSENEISKKGDEMTRREQLDDIFRNVDEDEKRLVDRLIDEVIFLEEQMTALRKMPFIRTHPNDPSLQKSTAAAKQYKECSQSYMNAIRILASVIRKVDTSAQDDLLRMLGEFE